MHHLASFSTHGLPICARVAAACSSLKSRLKSSRQHPDARNKKNLIHAQLNIYVLIIVNQGLISIPLIPVCVEKLKQNEKNKMRNYARCLFFSFDIAMQKGPLQSRVSLYVGLLTGVS